MNILNLSAQQLKRAADIKEQITALEQELQSIAGGGGNGVPSPTVKKAKRKMSDAGRLAIAAAQKARWAKAKVESVVEPAKVKRTMSPAVKAKIAAAARLRWKKAKAAGKNAL